MRRVYLDHNATTPLRSEARELLVETLERLRGNPSSLHRAGREARQLLDEARERIAAALGVEEDEIVLTSGGTESNNLALQGTLGGMLRHAGNEPIGLVTTAIEHASVLAPARRLAERGLHLDAAEVDLAGRVDIDRLIDLASRPGTRMVSVMSANNEVGSLGPLEELGAAMRARPAAWRPLLHTDGVQALGRLPIELREWGIDLATFSAHKIGGPVGVGILYVRRGVAPEPLFFGGEQETGLRPGTEDVAGALAAARAVELAVAERASLAERLGELARTLWQELAHALPEVRLHGPAVDDPCRLPGTLNVRLPGIDGKVLVTRLDLEGLEVSAGSACASGSIEPSHVLRAMGLSDDDARAGLRLSLGRTTTLEDVRQAVDILRTTARGARAKLGLRTGL